MFATLESQIVASDRRFEQQGKLLAELIDQRFETRKEFAQAAGISINVLSNHITGVTPIKGQRREDFARLLGVAEEALRVSGVAPTLTGPVLSSTPQVPIRRLGYRTVPIYASVPAGRPGQSYSDAVDLLELPDWGTNFNRWAKYVEGDSMTPKFLDGDLVIFEDRRADPYNAVHAIFDGQQVFKYLVPVGGTSMLTPGNPTYESISAEGWTILGVAVELHRELPDQETAIIRFRRGARYRANNSSNI